MHSSIPLLSLLKQIVRQEGPIPLSRFMEMCLYHPKYGYYIHRNPIGVSHDFITAPEVSQLFGEMIGIFYFALWEEIRLAVPLSFVEFGPGQGTLLVDILRVFQKINPSSIKNLSLFLLESNIPLRSIQEEKLSAFDISVQWFSTLEELLYTIPSQPAFFLGNEFLDTFPIDQYIFRENTWCKKYVTIEKEALEYLLLPTTSPMYCWELDARIKPEYDLKNQSSSGLVQGSINKLKYEVAPHKEEKVIEYSEKQMQFLKTLCTFLKKNPDSFSLFIDYGYIKGDGDSFQAVKEHAFVDPLTYPGLCDLTAHVNFGILSDFFVHQKLYTYGPIFQETFLNKMGINIRIQQLIQQNPDHTKSLQESLFRLTSLSQMGSLFKVLGVSSSSFFAPGF